MKQMRTYLVTNPEDTSKVVYINSSRPIVHASIGIFSLDGEAAGEWFATLSAQADPIKAAKAAKGTNKYVAKSILGTLTEVEYDATIKYERWVEVA